MIDESDVMLWLVANLDLVAANALARCRVIIKSQRRIC